MNELHFGYGHPCGGCSLSGNRHLECPALKYTINEFRTKPCSKPPLFGSEFAPDYGLQITDLINMVEAIAGYEPFPVRDPIDSQEYVYSMMYALQEGVPGNWTNYIGRTFVLEHGNDETLHYSIGIELLTYPIIVPNSSPISHSVPGVLDGTKLHMIDTPVAPIAKAINLWPGYGAYTRHFEVEPIIIR